MVYTLCRVATEGEGVKASQSKGLDMLFTGEGEMCHRMRSHDWSQTPLGPVEQWPQSLRTTVSILLHSRHPMCIFWGPSLINLYNDGYRPLLSLKHPLALGQPGSEVWLDIWETIGPLVEQVFSEGQAVWLDNFRLFMRRSDYLEEVYFTFSYSPIQDESGGIGGMLCACIETTQQVLGERRLRTLRDLAAQIGTARSRAAIGQIAMTTLADNPADLPFALLYWLDAEGKTAVLAGTTGIEAGTSASPSRIDGLDSAPSDSGWPLAEVARTQQAVCVRDMLERFGPLSGGDEPLHTAIVLPVMTPRPASLAGFLITGISERRALDDDYQDFLQGVAGQIGTAIAGVRAEAAERQRVVAEEAERVTDYFNQVIERMTDGFIALDQDWRVIYQNAASEAINRKPRSTVLGKTCWEAWPAAVGTPIETNYRRAMGEQVPVHFEHHYFDPPDYDLWVEVHVYPLREGLGIFYRDITERKVAEATLQENQRQLQQQLAEIEVIYQSAPIGLNVLDADLRFVRINERLAEMNGLPVAAHIGHTIRDLLPNLADTAEQFLRSILTTGEPLWNVEIRGETPAQPGVERIWLEHFLPLKRGDRVIGVSTVCEEITDRKQVEALLLKREEQLRLALEFAHIGSWDWDVQTGVTLWNDNHFRLLGLEPGATTDLYNCWQQALHPDDRDRVEKILLQALAQHQEYEAEYRVLYPDGSVHWLMARGHGLYDESGHPTRMLGVIIDVSDRKQATIALAASLQEKDVLLKEIHHRVKNNLGIVRSLLQLQARRITDSQLITALRDCQSRIASIALVHEKLYRSENLAKIDFTQYIHDLTVYLFDAYNINISQVKLNIEVTNIDLNIEVAVPCGLIINELVSNALKYAFPDGRSGEIWVQCYPSPPTFAGQFPETLTLIVRDNGIGLPSGFDLAVAQTLGMQLVQGLVQQIKGKIAIQHGQGIEFKITFPQSH